jgi:predicted TIM-barrel fold metal-dependent hydrolase
LSWSVGFMFDTTLAITRMIFDGFFDRHPNLKIIASHGGGTLPYLVGRFEKGDEVEIPSRRRMQRKPTDYLRHIYYDSITYNFGALQYLISVVGADHVMFGTGLAAPGARYEGCIRQFGPAARRPVERRSLGERAADLQPVDKALQAQPAAMLDASAYDAAYAEGRAMSLEQALGNALAWLDA